MEPGAWTVGGDFPELPGVIIRRYDSVIVGMRQPRAWIHIVPRCAVDGRPRFGPAADDGTVGAEIHIFFRQPFADIIRKPSWFLSLAPIKSGSLGWAVC